jgi:hypothetical protein
MPDFGFWHLVVGDSTLQSHFSFVLGLWVPTKFHVHIFIDLFDQESPTTNHQVLKPETQHAVLSSR